MDKNDTQKFIEHFFELPNVVTSANISRIQGEMKMKKRNTDVYWKTHVGKGVTLF